MRLRAWLHYVACGAGLLLCGCGGKSVTATPTPVTPDASALAGNWLIVGPMPAISPSVSIPPQPPPMRLALTVDAVGNNIVAAGFGTHLCGSFMGSFSFAPVVTGTVAQDGSFSLGAPPVFPDITVAMTGKMPATAGTPWAGSYTVGFTELPGFQTDCVGTFSDTFTAISFPLVNGVYAGTASSTTSVNGAPTTTTMALQVTLQQGGTATDIRGRTVTSNTVLTGSIKVQGSPCFSSGTTNGSVSSSVLGNEVSAAFTMDDGSTLELSGSLTDASESRIATNLVLLTGGQCGGSRPPFAYRLPELDRQS